MRKDQSGNGTSTLATVTGGPGNEPLVSLTLHT